MSLKKVNFCFVFVIGLFLMTSCTPPVDVNHAEVLADQFYQTLMDDKFEQANSFYRDADKLRLIDQTEMVRGKLGKLNTFKIKRMEPNTVYSGKFYIVDVQTQYEKDAASETLTMFQHVEENQIKVISRKIRTNKSGTL